MHKQWKMRLWGASMKEQTVSEMPMKWHESRWNQWHERTNAGRKEGMREWKNEGMKEWTNEPTNGWMRLSVREWVKERMNQWMIEGVNPWMSEWMGGFVDDSKNYSKWMNQGMIELKDGASQRYLCVWYVFLQTQLSLQSCAHFVDSFRKSHPKPAKHRPSQSNHWSHHICENAVIPALPLFHTQIHKLLERYSALRFPLANCCCYLCSWHDDDWPWTFVRNSEVCENFLWPNYARVWIQIYGPNTFGALRVPGFWRFWPMAMFFGPTSWTPQPHRARLRPSWTPAKECRWFTVIIKWLSDSFDGDVTWCNHI